MRIIEASGIQMPVLGKSDIRVNILFLSRLQDELPNLRAPAASAAFGPRSGGVLQD